jgi:hypothetical protein
MSDSVKKQIQALIDREALGLTTKNPDLFLDMIHPDMVWPWPRTSRDHDPVRWKFVLGRFNKERWRQNFHAIFDNYDLVRNHRNTVEIEVSVEDDAAFAVMDIDCLWRDKATKQDIQWKGRVCKFYTRTTGGDWKFILLAGPLDYGSPEQNRVDAAPDSEPATKTLGVLLP